MLRSNALDVGATFVMLFQFGPWLDGLLSVDHIDNDGINECQRAMQFQCEQLYLEPPDLGKRFYGGDGWGRYQRLSVGFFLSLLCA